ncbi:putative intercellular adhesion protein A [Azorhizobium caulinodans ORS 571]|uniref:Putative intercellular adhesion protein A n=1 Tax=Azorhizobium caulinodans (strain ATCC 43989 / DSM 5975 / JCM 20966 / LMG 6465 / NBRC 14845 / NCIMB 13405 / ORS 571) TaxID=438753 RepID=A8HZU0_AZOC5|nr:sugar transferase [Azorhizobium caulinodans]BAF90624.1 putative intercellular adhesion protein A [Azorhizobium caulinodans ORS 571]
MIALELLFWLSLVLVAYHHAVFPALLRALARRRGPRPVPPPVPEADLPVITLVVPAYQEAAFIAAKLKDCAALDYPRDRLKVIVACDGCTDGTPEAARAALASEACAGLNAEVRDFPVNRGKVAVLNEVIAGLPPGLVALSDVSASLSPDALRRAAAHFADPRIGVVAGTYALRAAGSAGEAGYWRYQTAIKADEAALAAPIGCHGAFYMFRRELWAPLPPHTINDDVILPMRMVAAGAGAVYDRAIVATEEERTHRAQEFRRRVRIASGNVQQALWLWRLGDPRRPDLAFIFLSGKALRAFVPFLLVILFVSNLLLAFYPLTLYRLLLVGQVAFYGLALFAIAKSAAPLPRVLRFAGYFVEGHGAGLIGALRQLTGKDRGRWGRAAESKAGMSAAGEPELDYVHPVVRVGKRAFDIVVGAIAFLVLAAVFVPVALAIKLTSKGPIFYRQIRVGRSTETRTDLFYLFKFRTMYVDAEARTGPVWATANDPRITPIGRFMRKTRIDELPQAINVLKGDMSIVGPRPERPAFFLKLEKEIPFYVERTHGLRPGITGLAQVNQGYDGSIEDVRSKVGYDHAYAMRLLDPWDWIKTDLSIIFRTAAVMVLGKGQ